MESPMQAWLLSNVAGWDDDMVSRARFKALTGQRADWEARFVFWKDLIVLLARHLNLLVVDTHAVQHFWFLRKGLTPLCIRHVLQEMCNSGDLQNLDDLQVESRFSSFWQQLSKIIFLGSSIADTDIPRQLVVTTLVHDRIAAVMKCMSDNCWWTTSCVITIDHLNNICGCKEDASIVIRELVKMKRGRLFVSNGSRPVKGFKISLSEDHISDVSELDIYMLHLYWTLERLTAQIDSFGIAYNRSKQSAIKAIKDDRISAKRYIQVMKKIATSRQKCVDFHGKIQEVLVFIQQAETTKQVSEALKTGANALKEHLIPVEDIEANLEDLDEALLRNNELAEALGTSMNESEDESLEAELALLELELSGKQNEATSLAGDNVADVDKQKQNTTPSIVAVDVIEQAMEGLELNALTE